MENKRIFKKHYSPTEFNWYMTTIFNTRVKLGLTGVSNYKRENTKLLLSYTRTDSEKEKAAIRERLNMLNITMAHEVLYRKLKVNILRRDAIDILQEVNMELIATVDRMLKRLEEGKKATVINTFSIQLYYGVMNHLDTIRKKYYNYNEVMSFDTTDIEELESEPEEKEFTTDDIEYAKRLIRDTLRDRDNDIMQEYYLKDYSMEVIEYYHAITKARIQQVILNSKRKLREAQIERELVNQKSQEFKRRVYKLLEKYPLVRYVIISNKPFEENDLFSVDHPFNFKNELLLTDKLLLNGIDPKEWLIILPYRMKHRRLEYRLFNYGFIPREDYSWEYSDTRIYDRFLMSCSRNNSGIVKVNKPNFYEIRHNLVEIVDDIPYQHRKTRIKEILGEKDIEYVTENVKGFAGKFPQPKEIRMENIYADQSLLTSLAAIRMYWSYEGMVFK